MSTSHSRIWLAVLVASSSFVVAAEAADETSQPPYLLPMQLCDGRYAICDAAPCTPLAAQQGPPGSPAVLPTTAVCQCEVRGGKNLGPGPCENRIPSGANGEYIMSTYSYALPNSYLTCPAHLTRTVCFGYPCVIDKKNPYTAHCTCPIVYDSEEFKTQGGDCNKDNCVDLWQGGTPAEYKLLNEIFTRATGEPPPPDCPANAQ
jgi:hypothetical protein